MIHVLPLRKRPEAQLRHSQAVGPVHVRQVVWHIDIAMIKLLTAQVCETVMADPIDEKLTEMESVEWKIVCFLLLKHPMLPLQPTRAVDDAQVCP